MIFVKGLFEMSSLQCGSWIFQNYLTPIVTPLYALVGFKIAKIDPTKGAARSCRSCVNLFEQAHCWKEEALPCPPLQHKRYHAMSYLYRCRNFCYCLIILEFCEHLIQDMTWPETSRRAIRLNDRNRNNAPSSKEGAAK